MSQLPSYSPRVIAVLDYLDRGPRGALSRFVAADGFFISAGRHRVLSSSRSGDAAPGPLVSSDAGHDGIE